MLRECDNDNVRIMPHRKLVEFLGIAIAVVRYELCNYILLSDVDTRSHKNVKYFRCCNFFFTYCL